MKNVKLFGVLGSVFLLLRVVPEVGGILILLGFITTLIAIVFLYRATRDRYILLNYSISLAITIITTIVSAVYITIAVFNPEKAPFGAELADIVLGILPLISAFFLLRSYRRIAHTLDVFFFSVTGIASLCFAILATLFAVYIGLAVAPAFAVTLRQLIILLSFIVIPVLQLISFARIPTKVSRFTS